MNGFGNDGKADRLGQAERLISDTGAAVGDYPRDVFCRRSIHSISRPCNFIAETYRQTG
jgi:hypothetical protein